MATRIVECPECGHKVVSKIRACPKCGASIGYSGAKRPSDSDNEKESRPRRRVLRPILLAAWLVPVLMAAFAALIKSESSGVGQFFGVLFIGGFLWGGIVYLVGFLIRVLLGEKMEGHSAEAIQPGSPLHKVGIVCFVIFCIAGFVKYQNYQEEKREAAFRTQLVDEARKRAEKEARAVQRKIEHEAKEEACKKDWKCQAERGIVKAIGKCQPLIERKVAIDFEWTDGIFETKFSRFGQTAQPGVYVYKGDALNVQLRNGNWMRHVYECTYSPEKDIAYSAAIYPGRLK